jgi:predicted small lipoprotein YifL
MRALLTLLILAALLAGCGHKGPLYLPKSKPEAQRPAAKPAPARDERRDDGGP